MIELRSTEPEDLVWVSRNMRAVEVLECAATGRTPLAALWRATHGSVGVLTATLGEEPIAILGLWPISIMAGKAAPWMLGTDAVMQQGRALLRLPAMIIPRWQAAYPRLENHVHAENAASIRWLTRLGFTVEPDIVDIGGQPMRLFWKGP